MNKAWGSADRASPTASVVTGDEAADTKKSEELKVADQPMLIYVTDGSENEDLEKIENIVLQDFKVAAARNAFPLHQDDA